MGPSIGVTHGTATKMNATGKAKWRSHDLPPTYHGYKRVSVTTDAVRSQARGRHSGFAISKRRNEPAVIILLINRPFAAELLAKKKPKRRQHDESRHRRGKQVFQSRPLRRWG